MPYGAMDENANVVQAGSLELLGQRRVIGMGDELGLADQNVASERLQMAQDDPTLEDAVDAVLGARVVIVNPPFTNRGKMGEKFSKEIRRRLRERVDGLERALVQNDPELDEFSDILKLLGVLQPAFDNKRLFYNSFLINSNRRFTIRVWQVSKTKAD